MYTLEQRMKAVNLYFKYDRNAAATRRELGYPSRAALREWITEYETTGTLHDGYRPRASKYTDEQKRLAVEYYLQRGRSIRGTVRALGYPNRQTLADWVNEGVDERRILHSGKMRKVLETFSDEQKLAAIVDLAVRDVSAQEVADKHGVTRAALYKWRTGLSLDTLKST